MKIDSQDIIRTAQQLCDEENKQLHVRPWNRSRHFHVPAWLVALPAAAIVGFTATHNYLTNCLRRSDMDL